MQCTPRPKGLAPSTLPTGPQLAEHQVGLPPIAQVLGKSKERHCCSHKEMMVHSRRDGTRGLLNIEGNFVAILQVELSANGSATFKLSGSLRGCGRTLPSSSKLKPLEIDCLTGHPHRRGQSQPPTCQVTCSCGCLRGSIVSAMRQMQKHDCGEESVAKPLTM